LALILFILLFRESRDVNAEAMRAAGTADVVLSCLFGQTQNVFAFRTAAVNVRLAITHTVALKSEKRCDLLPKTEKIVVFFSSFIKILRHISVKRPRYKREIQNADGQLRYAREEEIDDYENEADNDQKIIKSVNTVSALHKLPKTLAEWSFVFHIKPPGECVGTAIKPSP
jgi:hypothetical protein